MQTKEFLTKPNEMSFKEFCCVRTNIDYATDCGDVIVCYSGDSVVCVWDKVNEQAYRWKD